VVGYRGLRWGAAWGVFRISITPEKFPRKVKTYAPLISRPKKEKRKERAPRGVGVRWRKCTGLTLQSARVAVATQFME